MSPLLLLLLGLLTLILCVLPGRRRRRDGEPPLIRGWIPFIGKALEFGRDARSFLEENRKKFGDVFTVQIAGKYMTFIMNPLLYPNIIKHGRQLDFHEFAAKVAPPTFGYPSLGADLQEQINRSFQLLQGDGLTALTESMMGNLMLVFRQDHLSQAVGWRSSSIYDFCNQVMFEATFLTMYGRTASSGRHRGMDALRHNFTRFDNMFPLLIAQIPIRLLGHTRAVRQRLIDYFLPQHMAGWSNTSQFISRRKELLEQYDALRDVDKAAHHFAILWASVGNTIPACFWSMYYLLSDPEALELVRQEIHQVLRVSGVHFSPHQDVRLGRELLDKLLLLDSAINESLRLSSASMNIRVCQDDLELRLSPERSVAVRKGDIIALYPQSMHMDPDIYQEPQRFQLSRFLQAGREKTDFYKDGQRLRFYRMPFGSGSSMCPGRFFAINEIKQFLCLLLLYFDLQLHQTTTPQLDPRRAGLGILLPDTQVHFSYRLRD